MEDGEVLYLLLLQQRGVMERREQCLWGRREALQATLSSLLYARMRGGGEEEI